MNVRDLYKNVRFTVPSEFQKWASRYDFSSEELQNIQQQGISPVYTEVLDLTTAQSPSNPYILGSGGIGNSNAVQLQNLPARAFKVRGVTGATVYNPSTNSGAEAVSTGATVYCWINKIGSFSEMLPLKHGDGFHGDFRNLYLFWPAQSSVSMRFYIYRFDDVPYMSGDAAT